MDDRIFNTFGGRLYSCRMQTGKSTLYFFWKYKVDRQFLSRYEKSEILPAHDDLVQKIFEALNKEGVKNVNFELYISFL